MAVGRWAAGILILSFASPAWADDAELEMPVPVKVDAASVSVAPSAEPAARPKKRRSPSYRAVLGSLAIARDFHIPGSVMALRLLPTSSALAGETTTPIVLRPRVDDGYGVNIAARF